MPFQASLDHVRLAKGFFPNTAVYNASKPLLRDMMSTDRHIRLTAAREAAHAIQTGNFPEIPSTPLMGNHYHGPFSWGKEGFRVYPAASTFISKVNGEVVTGGVDHYSMYGADEARQASRIFGIPCTNGYELRFFVRQPLVLNGYDLSKTVVNAPNFPGMVYVVVHASTQNSNPFLRAAVMPKLERYRQITGLLNTAFDQHGVHQSLDFERIRGSAEFDNVLDKHVLGGIFDHLYDIFNGRRVSFDSIVERMLFFVADVAEEDINVETALANARKIQNDYEREYALFSTALDIMRAKLLSFGKIGYIKPSEAECPSIDRLADIAGFDKSILTYALLLESAKGTEHLYIDALCNALFKRFGFRALSSMPNRNTPEETTMVKNLCQTWEAIHISGMDVNKFLQHWVEKESADKGLIWTTLSLVGHEVAIRSGLTGFTECDLPYPLNVNFFATLGQEYGLRDGISEADYNKIRNSIS